MDQIGTVPMNKFKYRFFVDKECNWYQDGKPITHKRIYLYNYQNLIEDENGEFYVKEGDSKAFVKFEDQPFIVKSVNITDLKESKITIFLNDSSEENLEVESLFFNENIPYCKVKNSKFLARFSRPALFQLSKAISNKNSQFYIGKKRLK